MDLDEMLERELAYLKETQGWALVYASKTAQKRVNQAKINLAKAKENLKEAERGLEDAHKMTERTTSPAIRRRLEQTRKRALILFKKRYKERGKELKDRAIRLEKWIQ